MRRWLWLIALAACSGGDTTPPDAPLPLADADLPDADLPDADLPDAPWPPLTGDILERLQQIPGMTVVERTDLVPPSLTGYRYFYLQYVQPVDHFAPGGPTFVQRLTLLHRADDAPVVLSGSGYNLPANPAPSRSEPTRILEANQISIEHRFFTPSRPDPASWSYLTIRQSAADYHRVIQSGHRLYPASHFLVTGGSKGGETAVFHRRFYPGDVDGTVAYVAPLVLGAPDTRFLSYLAAIGPVDCHAALVAFQRHALDDAGWRPELVALLDAMAPAYTYQRLGLERAVEHAVLELPFALWQYSGVAACADIPADTATAQAAFDFIGAHSGWTLFSDAEMEHYGPYYYQAAVELGYPSIEEGDVDDLLSYPGSDAAPVYSPVGVPTAFDAQAMPDVQTWVQTEGHALMFVYGKNDPWSAAEFSLGGATDSFLYEVENGNHGSNISQILEPARTQARTTVLRWGGLSAKRAPSFGRPGEPEEAMPRRPR